MTESAGTLDLALISLGEARSYANTRFQANQSRGLYEVLPRFDSNFVVTQSHVKVGKTLRRDMPVLEETDTTGLKQMFHEHYGHVRTTELRDADHLRPIQKQIYFDKIIDPTSEHGIDGELLFITSKHIYVSGDLYIIDGHHRWASAMIIDPKTRLLIYRFDRPIDDLLPEMLAYSDSLGRGRNP